MQLQHSMHLISQSQLNDKLCYFTQLYHPSASQPVTAPGHICCLHISCCPVWLTTHLPSLQAPVSEKISSTAVEAEVPPVEFVCTS